MTRKLDFRPVPGDTGMEDAIGPSPRMNPFGRAICSRLLDATSVPYTTSAATNCITLLAAADLVTLMRWYAASKERPGGPSPLVPITLRTVGPTYDHEMAFMLRRGADAVRVRVGGEVPKAILACAGPRAILRNPAGDLFWDTRVTFDLAKLRQVLDDLDPLLPETRRAAEAAAAAAAAAEHDEIAAMMADPSDHSVTARVLKVA